jgi:hypothetical protein
VVGIVSCAERTTPSLLLQGLPPEFSSLVDPRLSHLGVERPPKPARGDALGQRPQEALQVFHVLDGSFGEELDRVVLSALTGATVVQVVSALLRHSPKQLGLLRDGLAMWAG